MVDEDWAFLKCQVPIRVCLLDVMRWKLPSDGSFSFASTWNFIRTKYPIQPLFQTIWNPYLTPTMSIFLWRLLQNKILMDEKVQLREGILGIQMLLLLFSCYLVYSLLPHSFSTLLFFSIMSLCWVSQSFIFWEWTRLKGLDAFCFTVFTLTTTHT